MKIIYTKHAEVDKPAVLRAHKFKVSKRAIEEVIRNPEHIDRKANPPNIIFSRSIDAKHVLRIVCRREDDIMKVITFYPAEKGRYY